MKIVFYKVKNVSQLNDAFRTKYIGSIYLEPLGPLTEVHVQDCYGDRQPSPPCTHPEICLWGIFYWVHDQGVLFFLGKIGSIASPLLNA